MSLFIYYFAIGDQDFIKSICNYENIHTDPYKIIYSSGNSIYGEKTWALFPWKNKLNIGMLLR